MLTREDIKNFSNDELKKALKQVNIGCGPITSTTRRIYENRLNSYYEIQKKQSNTESEEQEKSSSEQEKREKNDTDETWNKNEQNKNGEINENSRNGIVDGIDENHFSIEKPIKKLINLSENNNDKNVTSTKKSNNEQNAEEEVSDGYFYGVWIPYSPSRIAMRNKPTVFVSQKSTLAAVKKYNGSRFKHFKTREEAEKFSLTGPLMMAVDNIIEFVNKTNDSTNSNNVESKQSILKAPTIQEIQKYRKYIEENDIPNVKKCLMNPKYIINSKDFPVIVHEGSRLNSMHVAVKFERPEICELLMNKVNCMETYKVIYPDTSVDSLDFRKKHVENLYLNSPEKIVCDTPLHMACKLGFKDIVHFLLSFPATNVNAVNKDGRKASDIICTRTSFRGPLKEARIKEISALFEDKAYVPLYHGEDMAKVGQPIVTTSSTVASMLNKGIRACLGPCSPCQAEKIYRMWRKPSRDMKYHSIIRTDYEKGMERVGRTIAALENLPYAEYWDFLDSHVDLRSNEGLQKLEKYLKNKAERTRLCKTVAKNYEPNGTPVGRSNPRQFVAQDSDDIKRRLLFDNDTTSNDDRKISSTDQECYCRCGKLLGNCDDCSVDIDIDNLLVSFRMCCTTKDNSFNESSDASEVTLDSSKPNDTIDTIDGENEFDSPIKNLPDIYVYGDCPSKKDLDVLRALGDYNKNNEYPYVDAWVNRITDVPLKDRETWPTPGSPRYMNRSSKSILWTA